MNWKLLNTKEQLADIIGQSKLRPQIIFKHSTTCPISSMAKRRIEADSESLTDFDSHYLDLLSYRALSNHIAEFLEVYHESPQVIVINNGEATYDESHLDIDVQDILRHRQYLLN